MSTASRCHFPRYLLDTVNEQLWRDHELSVPAVQASFGAVQTVRELSEKGSKTPRLRTPPGVRCSWSSGFFSGLVPASGGLQMCAAHCVDKKVDQFALPKGPFRADTKKRPFTC